MFAQLVIRNFIFAKTSLMNNATENTIPSNDQNYRSDLIKIMLPYGLALLAQLPLLILYFRRLWSLPHYQPFAIAILATAGLAIYRWPFGQAQPFFRSLASDIIFLLGMIVAFFRNALCGTLVCSPECDANCDQFPSTYSRQRNR